MKVLSGCCAVMLLAHAIAAHSEIAISANDGKAVPADAPGAARTADSIAVLEIGRTPRTLATLPVPTTLVGPPGSVALTFDSRLAIITAGQVMGSGVAPVPGDLVTVVDVSRPRAPRAVQTLHAGKGAAGVAISPSGSIALVANTGADSVSIFTIGQGGLGPAGTVTLESGSRPVDVGFLDARTAYVVAQGTATLIRLGVDGTRAMRAGGDIVLGPQPYSLAIGRGGRFAYVSQLGARAPGGGPGAGSVAIVDLSAGRMVDQIETGAVPEHVGLSPRGRFLAVTVNNGSTAPADSPAFHDFGLLSIYRVEGARLLPAAQARTGRWCQGAAWSADERKVLLQCSYARQIEVFRFDGSSLTRDTTLTFGARPAAIATAHSR